MSDRVSFTSEGFCYGQEEFLNGPEYKIFFDCCWKVYAHTAAETINGVTPSKVIYVDRLFVPVNGTTGPVTTILSSSATFITTTSTISTTKTYYIESTPITSNVYPTTAAATESYHSMGATTINELYPVKSATSLTTNIL
jgi:hypothetical protein